MGCFIVQVCHTVDMDCNSAVV